MKLKKMVPCFMPLALAQVGISLATSSAMANDFSSFNIVEPRKSDDDMNDPHGAAAAGFQTIFGGDAKSTESAKQRLVIGVKFQGIGEEGDISESYRLFVVEGQVAVGKDAHGRGEIPAYQVRIVPFTYYWEPRHGELPYGPELDRDTGYLGYQLAEIGVERDAVIGTQQVKVKAFTFKLESQVNADPGFKVLASAAIDCLGYVWRNDLVRNDPRQGVNFVGFNFLLGFEKSIRGNRVAFRWNVVDMNADFMAIGTQASIKTEAELVFKNNGFEIVPFINLQGRIWEGRRKDDRRQGYESVNAGVSVRF